MANAGMVGLDWQQRINWDRLRKYRLERARAFQAVLAQPVPVDALLPVQSHHSCICHSLVSSCAYVGKDGTFAQSAIAPDSLATLPQRRVSAATNSANAFGEALVTASAPPFARRSITSGVFMVCTSTAYKRSTVSRGVPAGTSTPCQEPEAPSG